MISLEFVLSNLRLTVSEDLLPLSVQESPNLFVFRVLSLNFSTLRVTYVTANDGFPRSIVTHWRRRQTRRQAFSFRVIGSSSARIEERLTDGDVIIVEVFREPLLDQGLLGELDISLCNEVVVGLITDGRLVLDRERQQEVQEDEGGEEIGGEVNGEVEESHSTCAWDMAMTMERTRHKLVLQCDQGISQRTTTLTDNKRETTRTKDLQCMKTRALASTTLTLTCSPSGSGHFTHCWVLHCASCRQF